jgi:hypothetical protein
MVFNQIPTALPEESNVKIDISKPTKSKPKIYKTPNVVKDACLIP